MSAQFEDILSQKIKHTFDNLEVAYDPTHWQQLKVSLPMAATSSQGNAMSIVLRIAAMLMIGSALVYAFFELSGSTNPNVDAPFITEQQIPSPQLNQPSILQTPVDASKQVDQSKEESPANNSSSEIANINQDMPEIAEAEKPTIKEFVDFAQIDKRSVRLFLLEKEEPGTQIDIKKPVRLLDDPIVVAEVVNHNTQVPRFNIFASSLVNYSDAEEGTSFGIGGGFASAIPLTNRISISSGLSLAQQSIGVQPLGNDQVLPENVVDQSTSVDLFTIDIPLNLQYNFPSRSGKRTYISAGFSSFLYLREDFVVSSTEVAETLVTDENGNTLTVRNFQQNASRTSSGALSRLDFARVLNVSVGYHYPLGNTLNLIVEPYIKYPIGSLTSQSVQFGSGGINLRLGFK